MAVTINTASMNGSTTHVWELHENHEEDGIVVMHVKVLQLEFKLHTVDIIVHIHYILVYMTLYYMYSTSMTTLF